MIASYPENLRKAPKKPFAWEEPARLVIGPFETTLKVPAPYTPLPASGPEAQIIRFFGSDQLTPGRTSSYRYFAPKPTPPTHFSINDGSNSSVETLSLDRSALRTFF